jgi:hypothetical protein
MENFTKIEEEIKNVLQQVTEEADEKLIKGDTEWTYRIKELLAELGDKLDYSVSVGGLEKFEREWLYDLVWYTENDEHFLNHVPLVMECEWGRSLKHVKYDFEKLLIANSDHRLMICQAKPNQFDEFRSYFYEAIKAYPNLQKGSRFLIAILDDYNSGEFEYHLIIL